MLAAMWRPGYIVVQVEVAPGEWTAFHMREGLLQGELLSSPALCLRTKRTVSATAAQVERDCHTRFALAFIIYDDDIVLACTPADLPGVWWPLTRHFEADGHRVSSEKSGYYVPAWDDLGAPQHTGPPAAALQPCVSPAAALQLPAPATALQSPDPGVLAEVQHAHDVLAQEALKHA